MIRLGIFFCLFSARVFCSDFAVVDPTVLFLLHPDLRNLNFLNLRFEKEPAPRKGQSLSAWRKERSMILSGLSQDLYDLRMNRRRSLAKLNHRLLMLRRTRLAGYQKRMLEEAEQFKKATRNQEKRLMAVTENYYFDSAETRSRLKKIIEDVYETLQSGPVKPQNLFFSSQALRYKNLGLNPLAMDQAPLQAFMRPYFRFLQGRIYGSQGREHRSQLKSHFEHYGAMGQLFAPFFPLRPVVLGAKDRTEDYLRLLYESRKIPEKKIRQILETLEYWRASYLGDELGIYKEDA